MSQSDFGEYGFRKVIKSEDAFSEKSKLTELTGLLELTNSNEETCMKYFLSALYASVLEDTITQFRILEECNNQLRIIKVQVDFGKLVAEKFDVAEGLVVDELSGLDEKRLNQDTYTVNKLDKDRKIILTALIDTYLNLSLNRSFNNLTRCVQEILAQHSYRAAIAQEEAKNKQLRRELIRQLRQQRNHNMAAHYETDGVIDKLRTQVEDNALVAEARSRYVTKWQVARTEQHVLNIENKESDCVSSIEFYKHQIDREQRVHTEIDTIVNLTTNETLNKVEKWMNKYDTDMETIDLKIQIMKTKYENEDERRILLEKTYAKHVEQMNSWLDFKDQREKARQYQIKMNQSAIIVQAWWRGIQVRFQLGPYKVRRRRGGGKKK